MIKPRAQTLVASGIQGKTKGDSLKDIAVSRPNGGMMTVLDPSDIPNETFVLIKNARTRYDKTARRVGFTQIDVTKPNANEIRKLFYSKLLNGSLLLLRFTGNTIHRLGVSSWIQLSSAPSNFSISAGLGNHISVATVFDKILVADGRNRILYISGTLCTENQSAPIAKFITGFYNRGVAAYTEDTDGAITVKWTSEYQPGDDSRLENWDFSVFNDAGFERLVDSTADVSDFITGIQGFKDSLIITRDRSIWSANKQASASAPFRFYCAIPGVGSDCSFATAMSREGWVFADSRTRSIYVYQPGGSFERIAVNVETDIFSILGNSVDPVDAFATFDAINNEYHIQFGEHDWIFNFDTKSWQYDESDLIETVTSRVSVDKSLILNLSIDELVGTIDGLVGTIDEQTGTRDDETSLYIGDTNGEVYFEDVDSDLDDTIDYETIWESKDWSNDSFQSLISKLLWFYSSDSAPSVQVQYSTDLGVSWVTLRDWYTANTGLNHTILINKNLSGDQIRWRLKVESGRFTMLHHGNDLGVGGALSDDSI